MTSIAPRQLVNKRKYLKVMCLKMTLNMLATAAIGAGLVSVVNFVCWIVIAYVSRSDMLRTWLCCNLLSVAITLLFLFGGMMFRKSNRIEPVEVLSQHNAHRLPLQETLVRVAGSPSKDVADQLLRSPRVASEANRDELLRAINKSTLV